MSSRAALVALMLAACGDVSSPAADTCGTDVLPNGNFDAATPPWVADPTTPALLCGMPTINPDSAPSAACMGNRDGTTQTLSQTVELPDGASSVTLTGKICITTADTATAEHDTLSFDLLDGGAVIAPIGKKTNKDGVAACEFGALELTAPITGNAASATFRLKSTLDANMPTTFFVDTLKLTVGCTK
jgi:hypothetical protein